MKGVNEGTRYDMHPVGNSPEFMPMDNSLNACLNRSHERHCAITSKLHKNDPRKFSLATPKTISRGIRRLFECDEGEEGVPSSSRIIHDVDYAWDSMMVVYQSKGAIVQDRLCRNGHRYSKSGTGDRGGKRFKGELKKEKWLDPGARQVKLEELHGINPPMEFTDDEDDDSVQLDIL